MNAIDLHDVRIVLKQASTLIDSLDGLIADDSEINKKSARMGLVTRQLLVLADSLDLGAGLARNEYWKTKGMGDMLEEEQ